MSGVDEGGDGLLVDPVFLEADALVLSLDCRADADLAVTFAKSCGDVGDLPAAVFAALQPTAEMFEGFDKEALHMAGLEPLRLGAFHFEAKFLDPGLGHGVVCQRAAPEKLQEMFLVDRSIDLLEQPRLDLFPLAVLDGLEQEVLQRRSLEQLAEHIVDAPAERFTRDLQLLQEPRVNLALAGIGGDQIPQVADLGLTDTVNASEALLDLVGVPGQVVIDHQMPALKVHAFARGIVGDEHQQIAVLHEPLDDLAALLPSDT